MFVPSQHLTQPLNTHSFVLTTNESGRSFFLFSKSYFEMLYVEPRPCLCVCVCMRACVRAFVCVCVCVRARARVCMYV